MAVEVQELINRLADASLSEQRQTMEQLVALGADAVAPLIIVMNSSRGQQAALAAKVLSRIEDQRVVPALLSALANMNRVLQTMVINLLGELRDERALLPLLELLDSPDSLLQMGAIQALREFHDLRCVAPLIRALELTKSPSIRYTIIEVLGELGDPCAVEPIRCYKNDEDHHVRRRVEVALEKLNKPN